MEIVYIGKNDEFRRTLKTDGSAQPLTDVSQIQLVMGSLTISSVNSANDPILWNKSGYDTGEVRFKIGKVSTLSQGQYNAALVVIDAEHPDGFVWDRVPILVAELP